MPDTLTCAPFIRLPVRLKTGCGRTRKLGYAEELRQACGYNYDYEACAAQKCRPRITERLPCPVFYNLLGATNLRFERFSIRAFEGCWS